jgi:hypothetical protein
VDQGAFWTSNDVASSAGLLVVELDLFVGLDVCVWFDVMMIWGYEVV